MKHIEILSSLLLLIAGLSLHVAAENQIYGWRGDGTGRYPDTNPPTQWGTEKNVVWKTEMPGFSNACPIIVDNKIFICAEPATLICLNKNTGEILWQRPNTYADIAPPERQAEIREKMKRGSELKARNRKKRREFRRTRKAVKQLEQKKDKQTEEDTQKLAELKTKIDKLEKERKEISEELKKLAEFVPPSTHGVNGYSSPTPTTDGERVYALFGTGVSVCYDLDGNRIWARRLENPAHGWGHSTSPLLAGDKLIVHIQKLHALDKESGETLWAQDLKWHWGSPVKTRIAGQDIIVTPGGDFVKAADGTVLAKNVAKLTYCAPLIHDGIVYYIEHGGKAVRIPDTLDEPFEPEVIWETKPKKNRYYASPLYYKGLLYASTRHRTFSIIDAATGDVVFTERLKVPGQIYTSFSLAGKHIYVSSEKGKGLVLKPGRELNIIQENTLETSRTTPVFEGDRIYWRTHKHMYCIGD